MPASGEQAALSLNGITLMTPGGGVNAGETGSTEQSTTRIPADWASSVMEARLSSIMSRVDGPVLPAMSFVPARIATADGFSMPYSFPDHSSGPFGDDLAGEWMSADEVFHYLSEYGLGWKDIHASR